MELNQVEKGQVEQNQTNQMPPVSPTPAMAQIPPKRSKKWWVVLIIVLIIIAIGGGYYYWNNQKSQNENLKSQNDNSKLENDQTVVPTADSGQTTTPDTSSTTPKATTDETADWKTYTNTEYGFSFKYPLEWIILNNDISGSPADESSTNFVLVNNSDDYKKTGNSPSLTFIINKLQQDELSFSLDQLVSKIVSESSGIKNTFLGGIDAREVSFVEGGLDWGTGSSIIENKDALIMKNISHYLIIIKNETDRGVNYSQIIDQILSTFKFTP